MARFPIGMGSMDRFLFDAIFYFQKDLPGLRDDPTMCAAVELLDVVIADSIPDEIRLAAWETVRDLLGLRGDDPEETEGCQ